MEGGELVWNASGVEEGRIQHVADMLDMNTDYRSRRGASLYQEGPFTGSRQHREVSRLWPYVVLFAGVCYNEAERRYSIEQAMGESEGRDTFLRMQPK
eukprot:731598-Pyramimonas_sp.AAC.1